MPKKISKRLLDNVNLLPISEGMRILEIGCGPGTVAREIASRLQNVQILAIDRSSKAITQATILSQEEIKSGKLKFQQIAIEDFNLRYGDQKFDLIFAIRVGALDGRHPELGKLALKNIERVLKPDGRLFIDGKELVLS